MVTTRWQFTRGWTTLASATYFLNATEFVRVAIQLFKYRQTVRTDPTVYDRATHSAPFLSRGTGMGSVVKLLLERVKGGQDAGK